jgi:hypothetical protein
MSKIWKVLILINLLMNLLFLLASSFAFDVMMDAAREELRSLAAVSSDQQALRREVRSYHGQP